MKLSQKVRHHAFFWDTVYILDVSELWKSTSGQIE